MDFAVIREWLHEYINTADDQQLTAFYVLVEFENLRAGNYSIYGEEMMKVLYKRREDHRNDISKSYSATETIGLARKK